LDPLVGLGEGEEEEKENELDIQSWLLKPDVNTGHTLGWAVSSPVCKESKWKQQKLSFTDKHITFKTSFHLRMIIKNF
jgi:hypothetical protein